MMQAATAKSSFLHLQSREAGYSKAGKCGFRAALRAEGCRSGVHKEPLAAAISGSLCDSSRGEGAGRGGQRRSRGGWRGGAAGGARWAAGAAAKRGRASCAPARGPAVASGPSPGPATGAGKGLSETSGLMRGPKCCLGGGCAREDARGAAVTSPSPLGALGLAPKATRLRVPGGPATGPVLSLLPSAVQGALGRECLPEVVGTAQSSAAASAAAAAGAWPGPELPARKGDRDSLGDQRHLQGPQAQRGPHPCAQVLQIAGRAVPTSAVAATTIQPRPERAAWARLAGRGIVGARGEPKPGGAGAAEARFGRGKL